MKNHDGLYGMKNQEWKMKKYPQQQSLKEADLLIGIKQVLESIRSEMILQ